MKSFLNKIPLPITGMMLAFATAGNMLANVPFVRAICGIIAGIICIAVFLKIIFTFSEVKEALNNPVAASVFSTFDMGVMVLCTYIKPFSPGIAKTIWLLAIAFHVLWMIYVLFKFLIPFEKSKFFPSMYIPFVGIAVSAITAPAFEMQALGKIIFYFGAFSLLVLTVPILSKTMKTGEIPAPIESTKAIIAAPASLCLAGYLSSFEAPQAWIVYALLAISLVLSAMGIYYALKTIGPVFKPAYSAYTFPTVISAFALLKTKGFLGTLGTSLTGFVGIFYYVELTVAILLLLFVLLSYIKAIFIKTS